MSEGRSLILCGPTGTGKTHLGIAIAYRAIQNGYETPSTGAAALIESTGSTSTAIYWTAAVRPAEAAFAKVNCLLPDPSRF